jgi:hypothetical protein
VPTAFTGNVQNIKMIPTDDVMTDTEWLTATTTVYGPVSSNLLGDNKSANLAWHFNEGKLSASFQSLNTEPVQITLRKISGQIISQKNFEAQAGMNNFEIMSSYRGTAILQIKQGSTSITKNIPML